MKRLVVDIEASNLLANMLDFSALPYKMNNEARLWCAVVRDVDTDETVSLFSPTGSTITKEQDRKHLKVVQKLLHTMELSSTLLR